MRSASQFVYEGIYEIWKKSIGVKNIKINSKKSLFSRATAKAYAKLRSTVLEPITNMAEIFWNKMQASFSTAEHWKFFSLTQIANFWWKKIFFMQKKKFLSSISCKSMFFSNNCSWNMRPQNWSKIELKVFFFTPCWAKIIWKRKFTTLYFLENIACSPQWTT